MRGWMGQLTRWAGRGLALLALLFALSLLWGRFLPVSSTLMAGRWLTGQAVERQWRPASAISPALMRAVIAAEDQRFCAHWGVDLVELQGVLDDNGGPARGASTITMQVVKNVWLWPGRSYLRKGVELGLAPVVDLVWGKARVLEVYLNVAEWGDGVFGAETAAQHYFGISARALTPAQAARLAASLPNPLLRDAAQSSAASRRIAERAAGLGDYLGCLPR